MRFKNYVNSYNRRNRIYSDEDLLAMTLKKIFENEEAIVAQNNNIGIPSYEELYQSPNTEWIKPYTNNEGKEDGGYWQSVLEPEYKKFFAPKQSGFMLEGPKKNFPLLTMNESEADRVQEEEENDEYAPILQGGVSKTAIPQIEGIKEKIQEGLDKSFSNV